MPARALLAALAALLVLPSAAHADCFGALPATSCPYTFSNSVGLRAGGVMRFPQAVAVGPDGSVYVSDQKSHVIQVFGPNGAFVRAFGIYGLKPGQMTSSGGVAVAPDNSVFVATGGNRIEHFDSSGNLIKTIGHSGSDPGEFAFGAGGGNDSGAGGGIAVSGGFIYVADTGNDRVQRIGLDGSDPRVIVPAGTLRNPMGIAVRKTRVFVADDQNHRIVVFDTGGKQLATIGKGLGPSPGQLNAPYDVAVDPQGRVFVADDLNHRVSRFSSAQTGYAYKARWGSYGTAPGQLAYPRGIATDGAGNVYVANTGDDRIDVFSNGGRLIRSMGTSGRAVGQFDGPTGIAADATGVRAVTDAVNGRVQFINPDGSIRSAFGSPNPGPTILPKPVAVAFDPSGNVYAVDQRRGRILVFSRVTGQFVRQFGSQGSGPGQMLEPSAISISPGGTVFVGDTGNERVLRFGLDGSYAGAFTGVGDVRGIAVTPDGQHFFVTTGSDNRITSYDFNGNMIDEFGGSGRKLGKLSSPAGIAVDGAGTLWVADKGNNRVQHFGPTGERLGAFGERGGGEGQFVNPTGVSVDCRGVLSVADFGNNRVQQFALASGPTSPCGALAPVGIPPAPKAPTLPAPDGPQITVKVLRSTKLLSFRSLPVRVSCDTACSLATTAIVAPRAKPAKGKKAVSVSLTVGAQKVDAGASKLYRLSLSNSAAAKLRKALRGRKGISIDVTVTASGSAGEPTSQTVRVDNATA